MAWLVLETVAGTSRKGPSLFHWRFRGAASVYTRYMTTIYIYTNTGHITCVHVHVLVYVYVMYTAILEQIEYDL